MENQKVETLLTKLIDKTKTDLLIWYPSSGENQFKTDFKSSSITMEKKNLLTSVSGKLKREMRYSMSIFNSNGNLIESIKYEPNVLRPDNAILRDLQVLYDLINKKHLKVDETLDDLLGELD